MLLHDGQVDVTVEDVRRLIGQQAPQFAGLPIVPWPEAGTDHLLFRIGSDLVARMPKIGWAAEQAISDARWLPVLAPQLPLAVPVPIMAGVPDSAYPFHWSVAPWLAGSAVTDPLDPASAQDVDPGTAAIQLGEFVTALRRVDPAGGPVKEGTARGVPLARLDGIVRNALAECGDRIDHRAAVRVWQRSVIASGESREHRWLHGDLLPGNLLTDGRRLTAVIDWGAAGVGDPAVDLTPAWTLFSGPSREAFREAAGLDEAAWQTARGWVIAQAAIGLPYYWERWPQFARACQRRIATASGPE
jgi:aminoglycoside phosphotransferase (APT) family kinase protein